LANIPDSRASTNHCTSRSDSDSSSACHSVGPQTTTVLSSAFFSSTLGLANKGRLRDVFDVAKKGWNWRDPNVAFYRTETDDEIRKRWEESKGELTREWKKRSKEASKMSRRKHGGVKADDD
jgi:hypothetical protein